MTNWAISSARPAPGRPMLGPGLAAMLAIMLAALLSGCVNLGGGKAPERLISFTPLASIAPGQEQGQGQSQGQGQEQGGGGVPILVVEPLTDRALAVSRVAVQVDATRIAYLPDVAYVERPARLFRGLLAEALRVKESGRAKDEGRAGGAAVVLEDDQPAPTGARRLSGRLLAMGYDAPSQAVVVRFDALWQGADGRLVSRRFEAVEPGVAPKPAAVAPALNRAANAVAAQVADWVSP